MERDLNNDEFEIFLKQKVDQHKLYPSDKAWRGIYNSLHPGMRWFKIGGTLLILSTLFIVYQETSIFNSTKFSSKNPTIANIATVGKKMTLKAIPAAPEIVHSLSGPSANLTQLKEQDGKKPELAIPAPFSPSGNLAYNDNRESLLLPISDSGNVILSSVDHSKNIAGNNVKGFYLHSNNLLSVLSPVMVSIPSNRVKAGSTQEIIKSDEIPVSNDNLGKAISSTVIGNTINGEQTISIKDLNWLQEMAAIKLTPPKGSKFNLQFYFSPTVSYRRLADNQNTSHSSLLNTPSVSRDLNINRYVDHNPAIGAELGSNILFSLTRNFTLKSGLQLNYSRYNIRAFKSTFEKASIALTNAGRIADTLSSYTSLRNFNGYASEDLQNQYLQVSIPVGAELKLIGNKRLQFSVAGSIQPTFLLFSDTYLLSTNYINYTKEPSLIRKWNVHSSFEAFLSYKTGGLRWQLGPQFRYQLMSSFNDRYPIKEYLFEYGVKIGVSKTLR